MGLTVGVDVGGTKIAAGVVDEKGTILERVAPRVAGDGHRGDRGRRSPSSCASSRANHDIEAVGVGAAGFVDVARSTVLFAPNLAWRDEPLKAELERADRAAGRHRERRERRRLG